METEDAAGVADDETRTEMAFAGPDDELPEPPPAPDPPAGDQGADLSQLVDTLQEHQVELTGWLADGKATVARNEARQQALRKQIAGLSRADKALDEARAAAGRVQEDAGKALNAATPLLETVEDDTKDELEAGWKALDDEITEASTTLERESRALAEKVGARADRQRELESARSGLDRALGELTELPKALKRHTDALKGLVAELTAASRAGHSLKAFVLALDVQAHQDALEEAAGDAHEAALVAAVTAAQTTAATAQEALTTAQDEVAAQEHPVTAARSRHTGLTARRADRMKELWTAQPEDPPAEGA